jgi:hypothetical protein
MLAAEHARTARSVVACDALQRGQRGLPMAVAAMPQVAGPELFLRQLHAC